MVPKALTYLMAFSAGFLLSIGILDLMPEGLENSPENLYINRIFSIICLSKNPHNSFSFRL